MSNKAYLEKTEVSAWRNGNLQPEIEINKYSRSKNYSSSVLLELYSSTRGSPKFATTPWPTAKCTVKNTNSINLICRTNTHTTLLHCHQQSVQSPRLRCSKCISSDNDIGWSGWPTITLWINSIWKIDGIPSGCIRFCMHTSLQL